MAAVRYRQEMEMVRVKASPLTTLIERLDWKSHRTRSQIDAQCPGYSGRAHWSFFKTVLPRFTTPDICILGVYQGRDIAYMATVLQASARLDYTITGVDKFTDSPGEDWPNDVKHLSWREAGFGEPPEMQRAHSHLENLRLAANVCLHQGRADAFLNNTSQFFDFIYIDISHDYDSTIAAIDASIPRLKPGGLLAGDDFSDQGNWGVSRAVRERFDQFQLYFNWLWLAEAGDYRKKQ
jgi:hypothetical protein